MVIAVWWEASPSAKGRLTIVVGRGTGGAAGTRAWPLGLVGDEHPASATTNPTTATRAMHHHGPVRVGDMIAPSAPHTRAVARRRHAPLAASAGPRSAPSSTGTRGATSS